MISVRNKHCITLDCSHRVYHKACDLTTLKRLKAGPAVISALACFFHKGMVYDSQFIGKFTGKLLVSYWGALLKAKTS
jgi:hypothetical protein